MLTLDYKEVGSEFNIDEYIDDWEAKKTLFNSAKKAELKARVTLCEKMFGKRQGEFRIKFNDGCGRITTTVSKVNTNVDMDELGFDKTCFEEAAQELFNDYLSKDIDLDKTELACFDIKISLNISRFNKLEEISEDFTNSITITPATPTATIKYED